MYHLELRKFPHVVCRFNQSEAQLRALLVPWARQEWVEEGERKWNVNEATLTILEGPKLSMPELAMGKGWRNAQKRSQDVTERVLGAVRQGDGQGQGQQSSASVGARAGEVEPAASAQSGETLRRGDGAGDLDLLADSLGLELLSLLDGSPVAPLRVWSIAQARLGERGSAASAAAALALAERAVGSLLGRGLAVLRRDGSGEGEGRGEINGLAGQDIAPGQQETVLGAVETWAGGGRQSVVIARKS